MHGSIANRFLDLLESRVLEDTVQKLCVSAWNQMQTVKAY